MYNIHIYKTINVFNILLCIYTYIHICLTLYVDSFVMNWCWLSAEQCDSKFSNTQFRFNNLAGTHLFLIWTNSACNASMFVKNAQNGLLSGVMPKFWWKHRKTNPARILISKILEVSNIRDGFITKKEMLAMSKRLSVDQVPIVRADQSKYQWNIIYNILLSAIRTGTIPDQTTHEK